MKDFVSLKAKEIQPSATLSVNKKARQLQQQGIEVINLSVGEPDFDTPEEIKLAAEQSLKEGFTKYTDSSGILELREAICEKLYRENSLAYLPDEIVVSNGAKHSLFNLMMAILNPGDEVVIPAPYWVSYPEMVKLAGGQPVICARNERFTVELNHLRELITPKTKAFILNSPSNPTGVVYTKKELEDLAQLLLSREILCISDEIYEKIIFDGKAAISIASLSSEIKDRCIVVNGFSKTFSMTGWRLGYLAAPRDIAKAVANIQSQTTSNPVSFVQKAALVALKQNEKLYQPMVAEFARRRDYLIKNLPNQVIYPRPDGAFYFFLSLGKIPSEQLATRLLEKYQIAVVPGKDFGADHFIRISFATSLDNLEKACQRLQAAVADY
ncbi:MAG: pyridoxal phosphate-dependent aminotransferase [Candidatus Omnitrophica bacterium]|nr:pyridoxal phosphate-dependent aminotransferase [Candidatus Omnitrophota bacterium]